MEKLITKFIDSLCAAAADDVERKVRIACLLRSRRIFLWAALPLVLALAGIAVILALFYLSVKRGGMEATFFYKITDIFSIYTGSLVVVMIACLAMVKAADKMLALLASLRPDEDPVAPVSFPENTTEDPEDESATFFETADDRQLESSRSVCESVG
jgi:hypothetical protein